jgi:hypothetical protein
MDQGRMCAHEGCSCRVRSDAPGGEKYCSKECASGAGCRHPDCDCAEQVKASTPASPGAATGER